MSVAAGLNPVTLFTQSSADPIPTAALLVTTGWYLWSVRRLKAKGRKWPWRRTASFLVAELLIAFSLLSGIAAYDDVSFTDHTIQHVGLGMLAPIFLAFSAPVTLLLQASHRRVQTGVLKVIHSPVGRLLSNPLITWPLYGGSLFALYFSGLYADTLTNNTLHEFVHLHLLVTGCLFYWPVIGIDPLPRRLNHGIKILYLMLALPFHTILGMALESQTIPIAPGISLADLHAGGALMWVAGESIGLIGTIAVFIQWLRADERLAARNDRVNEAAAAQQLALWRASREAAARAAST
ncbi:MAG TPA: cytochrome c oxidase assembly protein [Acidimicrobiales bacterium]|nr:cytochrome c oxidase assembly protein [Acidimicrobiales bacterium]